uniref:Uncharacterized protein n=1 Tax=Anguilla anguilla TaxID=7936 RepID=A0A0E9SB94_ANGAN
MIYIFSLFHWFILNIGHESSCVKQCSQAWYISAMAHNSHKRVNQACSPKQ